MATSHEVSCIVKRDRTDAHERIKAIGGRNSDGTRWQLDEDKAIAGIEDGTWTFYVNQGGYRVDVIVATRSGRKYLKTRPDGEQPDNLLNLDECP